MQTQYLVKYSTRLDEVVYEVYGDLKLFEAVLESNPHLHDKNILEADDIVYLVEVPKTTNSKSKEENIKALW